MVRDRQGRPCCSRRCSPRSSCRCSPRPPPPKPQGNPHAQSAWSARRAVVSRTRFVFGPAAAASTCRSFAEFNGAKEARFGVANFGPVDGDDRRQQRQRQLHARLVHAARWAGADVADAAGRGGARRRGSGLYGMLMFVIWWRSSWPGLMVGRAGVPGQEDRPVRDEDGDDLRAGAVRDRARGHGLAVAARGTPPVSPTPHGFSQILYAFSKRGNNNGSAFAAGRPTRRSTTSGLGGWFSRFWIIVPVLAVAGSMAALQRRPGPPAGSDADACSAPAARSPTRRCLRAHARGGRRHRRALTFRAGLGWRPGPIVEHLQLSGK